VTCLLRTGTGHATVQNADVVNTYHQNLGAVYKAGTFNATVTFDPVPMSRPRERESEIEMTDLSIAVK
jgi:hypothetical protein